jgi:5'-3' exonuclease
MGPVEVAEKFGVPPQLIADFLALAGDSVDDIPGAPGIGAKTAATLLNAAGSLEQLLADPGQVLEMKVRGAKRLAGILEEHKENLQLYRRITEIYCDIPLNLQLSDLVVKPISEDIWQFCDEMKFADRTRRRIEALMT